MEDKIKCTTPWTPACTFCNEYWNCPLLAGKATEHYKSREDEEDALEEAMFMAGELRESIKRTYNL